MPNTNGSLTVIVFVEAPLNERDFQRLGVARLIALGHKVSVFDVSPYSTPKIFQKYRHEQIELEAPNRICNLSSPRAIKKELSSVGHNCFCFLYLGFEFKHKNIFKLIKSKNIPYAVFKLGAIPYEERSSPLEALKNLLNFNWYIDRIYKRVSERFELIRPVDLFVTGGDLAIATPFPITSFTKQLKCHALDFESTLNHLSLPRENSHIVFIDEYQPFHPDFERLGVKGPDAQRYYKGLRDFFDFIEAKVGKKVVIAAHPRSQYKENDDYFGARQCIKGQTEGLIRDSALVLVNASTATKIAVAYHKPVISLTSDELEDMFLKNYIHSLSHSIGSPIINVDRPPYDFNQEYLSPNDELYRKHFNNYIKSSDSSQLPLWDSVSKEMKAILRNSALEASK